ncbi:MAG: hypothetical protein CIT01_06635 [Methanobacterium sp. BRmetb2]|jgi:hypothetical protein|nr:MAG: hypothetical protein CIT01_06635 [Methanobacterium sp. BRmetb2]
MVDKDLLFVGDVAKIIYNEEAEDIKIDWDLVLEAFEFKNLLEEHYHLLNSQLYDEDDYYQSIKNVLKDAYLENPDNAKKMMNHILKKYLVIQEEYPNEYPDLKDFLNDNKFPSEISPKDKNSTKEKIKVFIGYSSKDKLVAAEIKEILASFGVDCFMAHDDIGISEKWKKRILRELAKTDVFIPILSKNFKESEWCSQEVGIACFRNICFIPLKLDKEIEPYGFMNHRQGKFIKEKNIPSNYLITPIKKNFPRLYILDNLIEKLKTVHGYRNAEKLMSELQPFFHELSVEEVNVVVIHSINNNQIWNSGLCKRDYLPKFININKDKIDEKLLKKLKEKIRT